MLIWNKTNIFNSLFLVQTKQTKTNKQIINSVTPSWPSYEDHQLYHFHLPIPQPIYDPTDEYYPMPCKQLSLHPQKGIQRKQNHEKYHQTSLANVRTLIDQKNQTTHVVHFYWPRKEYYESKESNEKKINTINLFWLLSWELVEVIRRFVPTFTSLWAENLRVISCPSMETWFNLEMVRNEENVLVQSLQGLVSCIISNKAKTHRKRFPTFGILTMSNHSGDHAINLEQLPSWRERIPVQTPV